MKKSLIFILVVAMLSLLLLSSCNKKADDNSQSTPDDGVTDNTPSDDNNTPDDKDDVDDGKADGLTIVYADVSYKDLIFELYQVADNKYDFMPLVSNDKNEPSGVEIVFGKTSRNISDKAY